MPSAVPATVTKQNSATMSASDSATPPDPATAIAQMMEKKLRNLEKRKVKLDLYEQESKKGKELSKDQLEAVSHLGEVEQQLEVMKDLIKNVADSVKQANKQKKAEKKAEKAERVQVEISRLRDLLSIQDILSTLGNETVRKDFMNGTNGAVKLTEEELDKLDELYRKVCPCHEDLDEGQDWASVLHEGSCVTYSLLTNSTNPVPFYKGKTYADLLALVRTTYGYFDAKGGRSQSPEQAKSEAASTISNVEDNARSGGGEKGNEKQPLSGLGGQQPVESSNVPNAFNGGNAAAGAATAHFTSSVVGSITPPRKSSPSDVIGQSNQTNISFLQEDQSGPPAFAGNNTTFENTAINALSYNEPIAFQYNPAPDSTAPVMIYNQQQQPNVSSSQVGGYSLTFDSTASGMGDGGSNEQITAMKTLDPNAPTFVSQSDNVFMAPTRVSVSSQMQQQDSNQGQYFSAAGVNQTNVENVPIETAHGGLTQDGDGQGQQFGRGGGGHGGGRGRGGYRGGERGGGYAGRGRGGGYGYRGGQQGGWSGYDSGFRGGRGGGGGYRGGYRNDEPGRGGRGGGFNRRGGAGYEPRGGGRGGGGQRGGFHQDTA